MYIHINIKIIVGEYVLNTVALFDTGADSNCILEGLIPTKYFEETTERLSTANGSRVQINYKLSEAIIENQGFQIKTSFLLVKGLKNKVILETPFIKSLFPLQISNNGISTQYLGKQINFQFIKKSIIRDLNPIFHKEKQINFLKEELSFKNIENQIGQTQVQIRSKTF